MRIEAEEGRKRWDLAKAKGRDTRIERVMRRGKGYSSFDTKYSEGHHSISCLGAVWHALSGGRARIVCP